MPTDGALSQEEIDANRTQWHGEFDADKSGDLTITEFEALWLKARREMMVREYQEFDRDGDGKLTLDEYKAPLMPRSPAWIVMATASSTRMTACAAAAWTATTTMR